jgi:hypothetical protein
MTNEKSRPSLSLRPSHDKISRLMARDRIMPEDLSDLDQQEHQLFQQKLNEMLQQTQGAERDRLLQKLEPILKGTSKTDIWERNHMTISSAIDDFIQKYAIMPTKTDIAQATGLSRQTVTKHIMEYKGQPEFAEELEQFKYMSHKILAGVFKHASNGNMRAAKLYFEMMGEINKQPAATVVTAQNNYIQINNTILSQENLKNLTAAQLQQIENIVTNKAGELPVMGV